MAPAREHRLILASASPRRSELLRNAHTAFEVIPAHVIEELSDGESPVASARRLAREKANAIWEKHRDAYVLGADTIVVLDGAKVLGKPSGKADAEAMLRSLSGRTHEVITGVCLLTPAGHEAMEAEVTRVTMGEISEEEIRQYVATGEPMDKAGAYAIQGIASRYITRIEGDYSNVVGLPLAAVWKLLRENGW